MLFSQFFFSVLLLKCRGKETHKKGWNSEAKRKRQVAEKRQIFRESESEAVAMINEKKESESEAVAMIKKKKESESEAVAILQEAEAQGA